MGLGFHNPKTLEPFSYRPTELPSTYHNISRDLSGYQICAMRVLDSFEAESSLKLIFVVWDEEQQSASFWAPALL